MHPHTRLGVTPLSVPVRDFDRLLRESQREVLRLQRQIALRNQRETPPRPPSRPPGPAPQARAGAPAPGAPGEVCGDHRGLPCTVLRTLRTQWWRAHSQGLGSFPVLGRVHLQAYRARTCSVPSPGGSRIPPSVGLRPAGPGWPPAPAALPVVQPGRKSLVALAAARGPARAASSRCRRRAGTPPSAPAWLARPGPGYPGAAVGPPQLQVQTTLTERGA
ncbi:hypothetical protein P7K49_011045 [Saguinus oedipus]|uniref:Uncharacterized protein n=1 Tax=Saguinus oedipus TaxID=9490 RepID=A0ABQ9VPJ7_SAGOE|nr:hypothetical protein P7K49_011045 [Saguinus oedipus]